MLYCLLRNCFRLFFKLLYRFEVIGQENIPANAPVILVSNHISNWDPPVLGSASNRQVFFLAKEELFKIPLFNFLLPTLGVLPLKRGRGDREAISKSIEILSGGKILGIFIEGTRNKGNPDQLGTAQPGAAMFAIKSNAIVVPTLLVNTRTIGKSLRKVKVIFGAPLQLINDSTLEKKELYMAASHQIVSAIENLRPLKKA